MIRWAVTGPAGGGKSTLCRLLAERGAALVDGDALGHEVLDRNAVRESIRSEFGNEYLTGGTVDRAALGALVFGDPAALERLNAITLKPIAALATDRLAELDAGRRYRLAVLEAAVYFLFPPVPGVELVITVTADPATRLARLTEGQGLTVEQAQSRIAAQEPLAEGWRRADIVLDNSGPVGKLETAAEDLWRRVRT
jgi:dephospho-CoA kinase